MVRGLRPVAALSVVTAVGCLLAGAPALAATPSPEVPDAAIVLASAAARGAAGEASLELADRAEAAGAAVGGVAVDVRPVGRPPAAGSGATLRGRTWTWNGWVSGAAGPETLDGTFGSWRGEPLGLVGAWADRSEYSQTQMTTVEHYSGFTGEMDIAVGGLVKGETWEQAAAGEFVPRWTEAARRLKQLRGGKGTTYVRVAHEFNGDWMPWGVNSTNAEAYRKGYRLYASIIRKEFPQARLAWSPNSGHHSDVSIDDLYPGDDVVDVIAPDLYDFDKDVTTDASWAKETNAWLAPGTPTGLDAWRQYAARRGKPIALGEWGLAAGDDPEWIKRVHGVMAKYPAGKGGGTVAGRFVYDCYFNAESKFKLLNGPNDEAAAAYAGLTWGH